MPKQLLDIGDTFTKNGEQFEVVHVSANFDKDDKPTAFIYEVITKKEADANRKLNEESAEAERNAQVVGTDLPS